jgi:hypothetical protein
VSAVSLTNATTRASADDLYLANVLDMQVIDAAYSARVMRPLMRDYSLVGKPSDTAKFPRWPALTAASVAETADLANTQINTTSVTATVGEVGIMTTITDALTEDDILAGVGDYGRQLGLALADKQDADAAALLSGFSNATGVTTGGLTVATVLAAISALQGRDAPQPYVGVLHPVQWFQLQTEIADSAATIWSAGGDSRWGATPSYVGSLLGANWFISTNVPTNTRSATAVYDGAIFTQGQALVHVNKREARSETQRDASLRATEIVVTSRYAVAELVDSYGQVLYSNQA